jgi:hypothetical protein
LYLVGWPPEVPARLFAPFVRKIVRIATFTASSAI